MEYRNITRNAKMQDQGHGTMPHLGTCPCCGKCADLKPYYFTTAISAQVNGYYLHYECMENVEPTHTQCGNSKSKTLNHIDEFTIGKNEYDTIAYLIFNGYHSIKRCGAVGYRAKSVECINENAMNKIYSGLIAYGNNRPITINFENGTTLKTRIEHANNVIGLYNRLYNMKNTNGKPYKTAYEELSKLLIK